jgi:hypothetical protein
LVPEVPSRVIFFAPDPESVSVVPLVSSQLYTWMWLASSAGRDFAPEIYRIRVPDVPSVERPVPIDRVSEMLLDV